MNRRDLLRYLLSTPLATVIDYEKLLWIPGEKTIFIPSQAQIYFLYGIPYHYNNCCIGSWLGISRAYVELIKVIEKDKQ